MSENDLLWDSILNTLVLIEKEIPASPAIRELLNMWKRTKHKETNRVIHRNTFTDRIWNMMIADGMDKSEADQLIAELMNRNDAGL